METVDSSQPVYHRAAFVVTDCETVIENGYVCIEQDTIRETGRWPNRWSEHPVIDHGAAVILPGFVNAHTHLELSALKGKVPYQNGFGKWVEDLLKVREAQTENRLAAGAAQGIQQLLQSGTIAAGEVSTLNLSYPSFFASSLYGVFFREYLGMTAVPVCPETEKAGKRTSYAGHAPHTTAPENLRYLKHQSALQSAPFSIHLAESDDEITFITTGKGPWASFLSHRNIVFDNWPIPDTGSVSYCHKLGILDDKTLAVHLLKVTSDELTILAEKGVHACVCPRSNENIHKELPDIDLMLKHNIPVCIGTDSLASNESLSMVDELSNMGAKYPDIRPEILFKMATQNGADALGISNLIGTLEPGKKKGFITLDSTGTNKKNLIEDIVNNRLKQSRQHD